MIKGINDKLIRQKAASGEFPLEVAEQLIKSNCPSKHALQAYSLVRDRGFLVSYAVLRVTTQAPKTGALPRQRPNALSAVSTAQAPKTNILPRQRRNTPSVATTTQVRKTGALPRRRRRNSTSAATTGITSEARIAQMSEAHARVRAEQAGTGSELWRAFWKKQSMRS